MQLNVDGTVIASPGGFVAANLPVVFQFDKTGALIQPAKIWSNEELDPQNAEGLGTFYLVTFYDQNGAILNTTPLWWIFPETLGSTVDISQMVAISTVGGNILYYPRSVGGLGTVTSVGFVGDGTVLSATPSTPVITAGNITATLLSQSANLVLAGPATGSAAAPTFRALVAADFPFSTVAGSDTQVQVNSSGDFYADSGFTYNHTTAIVGIAGQLIIGGASGASTSALQLTSRNTGPTNVTDSIISLANISGGTTTFIRKTPSGGFIIQNGSGSPAVNGIIDMTNGGQISLIAGAPDGPVLTLYVLGSAPTPFGLGSAVFNINDNVSAVMAVTTAGTGGVGYVALDPYGVGVAFGGITDGVAEWGVGNHAGTPNKVNVPTVTAAASGDVSDQ